MTTFWPVVLKEFRTYIRGSRATVLISVYIGLLLLAVWLLYRSIAEQINLGEPLVSAQIGQALFVGLTLAIQVLTVFLTPALTVNTISSEYEKRTIDLLLTTPMSVSQVLLSKLLVAWAFMLLLLLSTLPLYSIVTLFGGVELADIAHVPVMVLVSAATGCVLGLFCSVVTRQTFTATLLCYALLISVIGGTLFAANLWSITHGNSPAPATYVFANPLSAMAAALASTQPPEVVTSGNLRPLAMLGLLTQGTLARSGSEVVVLPIYRATWVWYVGLVLLLFWVSLRVLLTAQLRRFWHISRADIALVLLLAGYGALVWWGRAWWLAGLGSAPLVS